MNIPKPKTQIFDGRRSVLKILMFLVSEIALLMYITGLLNVFGIWGMHNDLYKIEGQLSLTQGSRLLISLGGKGPYQRDIHSTPRLIILLSFPTLIIVKWIKMKSYICSSQIINSRKYNWTFVKKNLARFIKLHYAWQVKRFDFQNFQASQ